MEGEELVRGAQAISLVLRVVALAVGIAIGSLIVWIWRTRGG
jgi:hypothetical protein